MNRFSYARPAPLDMRMDQGRGMTAADVLNTYSQDELERNWAAVQEWAGEILVERGVDRIAARAERRGHGHGRRHRGPP